MAKKKRTSPVTPTAAAGASGYPPQASGPFAQGAMQHLRDLNFLLLKQTKDLREQIMQIRSEFAAVSEDRCIEEEIERDVCGVVFSSHLASTTEGCAALLRKADADLASEKAAAAETTASLLKKVDVSAADLVLANEKLLAASRKMNAMERDLERVVEERDLNRRELDEEKMKVKYLREMLSSMEEVSTENFTTLNKIGNQPTKKSKWRNSKLLYPAATTILVAVVSFAFAARTPAR